MKPLKYGVLTDHPNYDSLRSIQLKKDMIEAMGGKCVRCGETDIRCLQLDHIHDDGNIERNGTSTRYRMCRNNPEESKKRYQLLCANCNRKKEWDRVHNGS